MKILHELIHAIALSGAAWNSGDFGPEAPLLSLMHSNLDLHRQSPNGIVARTSGKFKSCQRLVLLRRLRVHLRRHLADGAGELFGRLRA